MLKTSMEKHHWDQQVIFRSKIL